MEKPGDVAFQPRNPSSAVLIRNAQEDPAAVAQKLPGAPQDRPSISESVIIFARNRVGDQEIRAAFERFESTPVAIRERRI